MHTFHSKGNNGKQDIHAQAPLHPARGFKLHSKKCWVVLTQFWVKFFYICLSIPEMLG